ncbi:MAG: hypothetical protein Roseis2KO_40670 [Roseivirga sp.]
MITKKELPGLIPFLIASSLVLTHVVGVLLTPDHLVIDGVKYAGFGLLVALVLILLKKSIWKYFFAALMVLALTPLMSLYHHELSLSILGIYFELKTLGLLILHCVLNREIIPTFKLPVKIKEDKTEQRKAEFEAAVEGFVIRFRNKSHQELESMLGDTSLVPAATEAARRLLQKND